jgi:hypothetical protein
VERPRLRLLVPQHPNRRKNGQKGRPRVANEDHHDALLKRLPSLVSELLKGKGAPRQRSRGLPRTPRRRAVVREGMGEAPAHHPGLGQSRKTQAGIQIFGTNRSTFGTFASGVIGGKPSPTTVSSLSIAFETVPKTSSTREPASIPSSSSLSSVPCRAWRACFQSSPCKDGSIPLNQGLALSTASAKSGSSFIN